MLKYILVTINKKIEATPTKTLLLSFSHFCIKQKAPNSMITIINDKINKLTKNNYKIFLESINTSSLRCNCGKKGCLIKHGFYTRDVVIIDNSFSIKVLRVRCSSCGKTHAILPHLIVPYSRLALDLILLLIRTKQSNKHKALSTIILITYLPLDESHIRYILKSFNLYWKEMLISIDTTIFDNLAHISSTCLIHFKRQFMQIKCVPNILI